jgi:hypothetical protein
MNTKTLVTTVKTLHLCGLLVLIAACSPSIDNGPDCRYNEAWLTSATNLYGLSLQYESCTGPEEILNGSSFDGLAYLDDRGTADVLVMAATGDVAGTAVSSFEQATRL